MDYKQFYCNLSSFQNIISTIFSFRTAKVWITFLLRYWVFAEFMSRGFL